MTIFTTVRASGRRSKSARASAALATRLFNPRSEDKAMRAAHDAQARDAQACIRSALRRRRRALGLTQEQAATVLGMPRLTYHRIESGPRRIYFADLAALCELYDCAPSELLQDSQLAAAYAHAARALLGGASA
jgi:DNA-binding XRE family transcriptional regulator